MTIDSKLFDRIRIQPRQHAPEPQPDVPDCGWEGCAQPGIYKAPKGHRFEGEYHHFCLEHVRHYNTAFNFFADMNEAEREKHLYTTSQTDGRPSWGLGSKPGVNSGPRMPKRDASAPKAKRFSDPLHIWARYARANARGPAPERVIKLNEIDRRAFEALGFKASAKSDEIKRAYKALVKIHHPDANGGDKTSEERLRAIIAAYSHLKHKGFVGN
ncbi:MAG: J domain-containing protein [Hyphomicrobiales bacterium]|nr:MAG: J domain-containing protein [Hyphomicrobiales bacterium]